MGGGAMAGTLSRFGLCGALTLVLVLSALPAFGQGASTSTISGTVVDASGGVLPGATISAKHLATGVITTGVTNTQGAFTLPSLPSGAYEVTITMEGFKTYVAKDVVLTAVQGASISAK